MRSARQVLESYLEAMMTRPADALQLYANDGVYEAPYLESLGLPWRYRGRDEVGRVLAGNRELFPRLEFHDLAIVSESPDRVVAEYQFTARSSRTARMVHQLIVARLESARGEITLLRESVNLVEVALALYAAGLADCRVPSDRSMWRDP